MNEKVKFSKKVGLLAILVVVLAIIFSITALTVVHVYLHSKLERYEVPKSEKIFYDSQDCVEL